LTIADELRKLQELHSAGALTDEEFSQAKSAVLNGTGPVPSPARPNSKLFPIDPTEGLTSAQLRTMRIIFGTLLVGVVAFLGIVLYVVQVQNHGQGMARPRDLPIVSLVATVVFGVCALLAFILPGLQTRSALRRILAGTWKTPDGVPPTLYATVGAKLMAVRQTTMMLGLGLLNTPAFLGCVAYLQEAHPLALGVSGAAAVLMVCKIPTEKRVRAWLERQAEVLNELHQQEDSAGNSQSRTPTEKGVMKNGASSKTEPND
jgi:hypothetical protein